MDKFTVNGQSAEQLRQVKDKLEIFDERGNLIGYFVNPNRLNTLEEDRKTLYSMAEDGFTREQLEAASRQPGVYTMDDVMKLLEDK